MHCHIRLHNLIMAYSLKTSKIKLGRRFYTSQANGVFWDKGGQQMYISDCTGLSLPAYRIIGYCLMYHIYPKYLCKFTSCQTCPKIWTSLLCYLLINVSNSCYWMGGKKCRPWSDAALRGVWPGSTLFAQVCLFQYLGQMWYQQITRVERTRLREYTRGYGSTNFAHARRYILLDVPQTAQVNLGKHCSHLCGGAFL